MREQRRRDEHPPAVERDGTRRAVRAPRGGRDQQRRGEPEHRHPQRAALVGEPGRHVADVGDDVGEKAERRAASTRGSRASRAASRRPRSSPPAGRRPSGRRARPRWPSRRRWRARSAPPSNWVTIAAAPTAPIPVSSHSAGPKRCSRARANSTAAAKAAGKNASSTTSAGAGKREPPPGTASQIAPVASKVSARPSASQAPRSCGRSSGAQQHRDGGGEDGQPGCEQDHAREIGYRACKL